MGYSGPATPQPSRRSSGPKSAKDRFRSPGKGASPAREVALSALRRLRERDAFAQDVIAQLIDRSALPDEERAFATRLVLGVVSTRGVLDEVLDRYLNDPRGVSPEIRDALELSAYEILYLDKSPHAAVDQGVELARSVTPKASGLANAVLRKLVEDRPNFPFGNPRTDIEAYARLHGFPLWLIRRLIDDLGPQEAHQFARASNEPPPLFIAINAALPPKNILLEGAFDDQATIKERHQGRKRYIPTENWFHRMDEQVLELLHAAHDDPRPASAGPLIPMGCYRLQNRRTLLDGRIKRLLNNGHMLVADAASQAVASLALPSKQPSSFLEIGAGRGTKTLLIQSHALRRWDSQIQEYVTVDNRSFKTDLTRDRAESYGIHVSEALTADATHLESVLERRQFDAVFIDAPCTGLGTLRRHPEIRWRIEPTTIEAYAELGLRLLISAAHHVKPGGLLTYSTCTVTQEENIQVIRKFLNSEWGRAFNLVPIAGESYFFSKLEPGFCDAHFAVNLLREK